MTQALAYLDTSAAAKLILEETGSDALKKWLSAWPHRLSSELIAIELVRAVRRELPHAIPLVDNALANFSLRPIADEVVILAGLVEPTTLKSLDAIHLATAVMLREAIGCFVTYDDQLAAAAVRLGFEVAAPV